MVSENDLEALLSKRIPPVGDNGRDWWLVLSQLRVYLKRIYSAPFVAADAECQKIQRRMLEARNMKEINDLMTELSLRVGQILVARGARPAELFRLGIGIEQRGRASLKIAPGQTVMMDGEEPSIRERTRIKL